MVLLQISEPGQSPEPHQRKRAMGIDLGTTNSLVASVFNQGAEVLPVVDGNPMVPSVVHYGEHSIEVGVQAKGHALSDSINTIASVKRLMGRGLDDIQRLGQQLPYQYADSQGGMPNIVTRRGEVSPVEVSAEILKFLNAAACEQLGGDIEGAVITVPAYFDEAQRQATKDAAKIAGLKVLRLLSEPTAAAIAYGLDNADEGVIAVYDLGGGTFDISVLRLSKGVFEVLATGGDSALGGDDFDRAIAEWVCEQAGLSDSLDPTQQRELMAIACDAKEALSQATVISISLSQTLGGWTGELTRDTLESLLSPLVEKTVKACRRALRDAGVKPGDVDNVVMVGGSTRTLCVRKQVEAYFQRPAMLDIDPDRVVALGAAMQADILVGNKPDSDMLLLDVIPLSLGIEVMGGLVEKIIPRNTTIPVAKAQEFTTFKDGQTAMAFHVLQGERELVDDCRSLARFELRGLPAMVAGAAHIRVTFQVDADGLLSVTAEEKSTGAAASIAVKPSYGLKDEEITRMLQDSYTHARDDLAARSLREQQVEADRVVEATRAALISDGDKYLSTDERNELEQGVERLQQIRQNGSADDIEAAIEFLNHASETFAARRMDGSIRTAMAGHSVDEFDQ